MKVYPFFLYGTARAGEAIHWMIEDSVADSEIAGAPGTQLYVHKDGIVFPFLVRTPGVPLSEARGELTYIREGEQLDALVEMELAVGYSLEAVRIIPSGGRSMLALSFVWLGSLLDKEPLESNSWRFRGRQSLMAR